MLSPLSLVLYRVYSSTLVSFSHTGTLQHPYLMEHAESEEKNELSGQGRGQGRAHI